MKQSLSEFFRDEFAPLMQNAAKVSDWEFERVKACIIAKLRAGETLEQAKSGTIIFKDHHFIKLQIDIFFHHYKLK
jgi:hypothetical protein